MAWFSSTLRSRITSLGAKHDPVLSVISLAILYVGRERSEEWSEESQSSRQLCVGLPQGKHQLVRTRLSRLDFAIF